jgi:hypothetical protein
MSLSVAEFVSFYATSATTPALTTSYAVAPKYADLSTSTVGVQGIGATSTQTFMATVTAALGSSMTGITLKVQVSEGGASATTAAATNWTDIEITNLATGTNSVEHTVSVSAGATATATFGTTNASNAPYCRVLVKSVGANASANESAKVTARAQ